MATVEGQWVGELNIYTTDRSDEQVIISRVEFNGKTGINDAVSEWKI